MYDEYDALITINEDKFQGISRIVVNFKQLTSTGLLTISTLGDMDDLITLIRAYDKPVISFIYFSDDKNDHKIDDEIKELKEQIVDIAESKGVIFHLRD